MPRHERERLRRSRVHPLHIVHVADHRALPGRVRQQAQDGQADREAVRSGAVPEAERGAERGALRPGQSFDPVQERCAQLMQPGEDEVRLRLHARGPHDPASPGGLDQVVQQRGLAGSRLAVDDQRPAVPGPDAGHQAVQRLALVTAATQSVLRCPTGGVHVLLTPSLRLP